MNKELEKTDKTFLKIPDENGEFTICVKKHAMQGETCYFEPNFQLNYAKDKIVRNDRRQIGRANPTLKNSFNEPAFNTLALSIKEALEFL